MIQKDKLKLYNSTPPSINKLELIKLASASKITLTNKIKLFYMVADNVDLIKLTIIFKDNSIWSKEGALNSLAVSKLIKEGSENYSSDKLKSLIEINGAKLFTSSNSDFITIDLYVIKENFIKTLSILEEIITRPIFPQSEIDKFILEAKNKLLVNLQKNQYLAGQEFKKGLFGDNSKLGYSIKEEDFNNIDRNKLVDSYQQNFQAANCVVIATGNISESDMIELKAMLGALKFNSSSSNIKINEQQEGLIATGNYKKHFQGVNKLQSTIIIGKALPNRNHPDYIKLQILNTVLGGYFGSYLMKNLREDKGYTYGVNSAITSNLTTGIFYINTEVNVKNYESALQEIYKEIDNISSKYISGETINIIKNYSIGEFRSSIKNIFSYSNLIQNTLFYNVDYPDYYEQYLNELTSINKEELKELAIKYLKKDFCEVVVGI
ncbi:MAG: M16 family metallopeptidase [Solitalea-like symbiont of Acarus siro]